jgi:hypothetical protein
MLSDNYIFAERYILKLWSSETGGPSGPWAVGTLPATPPRSYVTANAACPAKRLRHSLISYCSSTPKIKLNINNESLSKLKISYFRESSPTDQHC